MKTILLVDDDPQLRTMFGLSLRRAGYHVIEGSSGAEGLELARKHLPDLILTDIHMPGGDGSTLLTDIRKDSELRHKQVVLMTGRPDLVTPRKGMEEGADDFLVKPVSMEGLLNTVKARFGRAQISWRVEDEMLKELRSLVPANLPHEVFTPLAGIVGLMEILMSDGKSMPPAEIQDIHQDVYSSALRLHRTLRNYLLILDIQSITPDTPPILSTSEVERSIRLGIEEALRLNKRRDDIEIRVAACPLSIKPRDLSLIVEELVDNACKFSRHGTRIRVELTETGRLIVTDAGRGLTDEEIKHIGAFKQFDRKKQEQQGLGLGLVLVQKMTELGGATFSINSQPGQGTEVRVKFRHSGSA
jgi:two-component system, sensor histidine kinase and response regulator